MFCTKCGSELKEGALFCVKCGARIKNVEPAEIHADNIKTDSGARDNSNADNINTTGVISGGAQLDNIKSVGENSQESREDFNAHAGTKFPGYASLGDNLGGAYMEEVSGVSAAATIMQNLKKKKILLAGIALVLVCAVAVAVLFATGVISKKSCYVISSLTIYMYDPEKIDSDEVEEGKVKASECEFYKYNCTRDDRGLLKKIEEKYTEEITLFSYNDQGLIETETNDDNDNSPWTFLYSFDGDDEDVPSGLTTTDVDGDECYQSTFSYHSNGNIERMYRQNNSDKYVEYISEEYYDEEGYPTYVKYENGNHEDFNDSETSYKIKHSEKDGDEILKISYMCENEDDGKKNWSEDSDIDVSLKLKCDKNGNINKIYSSSGNILAKATWKEIENPHPFTKATAKVDFWDRTVLNHYYATVWERMIK